MLVQHLLTERLLRTIFDNQDFTRRNVIAAEVEKVIDALVSEVVQPRTSSSSRWTGSTWQSSRRRPRLRVSPRSSTS